MRFKKEHIKYLILTTYSCFSVYYFLSCTSQDAPFEVDKEFSVFFQSGFEGTTNIIHGASNDRLTGTDNPLDEKSNWDTYLPQIANPMVVNYTGGTSLQRLAKIVSDPTNNQNQVLLFEINDAWKADDGESKARVQCELYGIKSGLKEYSQSVRIFLSEDFHALKKYSEKIYWLTLIEIWNNITWNKSVPYGFRIELGIGKPVEGIGKLFFTVSADDCILFPNQKQKYTTVWSEQNKQIEVPVGEWFTLRYYFKEGNAATGRLVVEIETIQYGKQRVFDIIHFTHNTQDPSPDGVTELNPLKLYTSGKVAHYMKTEDKSLRVYWDDFKLNKIQ